MAFPSSSATTSGGEALATNSPTGAGEIMVVQYVDAYGHIIGARETFHVCDDAGGAFAASSRLLMLFNASATHTLEVSQLYVVSTVAAAITGLVRGLKAQRSTAIPSAGHTAITPQALKLSHTLTGSVTAYRQTAAATPATQALTANAFVGLDGICQEETGGLGRVYVFDEKVVGEPIILAQNQGVTIVNDATAMLGVVWAGAYFRQRTN